MNTRIVSVAETLNELNSLDDLKLNTFTPTMSIDDFIRADVHLHNALRLSVMARIARDMLDSAELVFTRTSTVVDFFTIIVDDDEKSFYIDDAFDAAGSFLMELADEYIYLDAHVTVEDVTEMFGEINPNTGDSELHIDRAQSFLNKFFTN